MCHTQRNYAYHPYPYAGRGTDVLGRFTGRNHVLYEGVVKRTRELRATPRM